MSHETNGTIDVSNHAVLAEALPHLVWLARGDGTVTYYNRRAALYWGIAPGDDGQYEWAPVVHPGDLERTQLAWSRAVADSEPYECEHRVRMADGSFRLHVSRALPFETATGFIWFGTATDTQMLVDARSALAESESRLRSVFSAIDQGYCVCELVLDDHGHSVDYRFLETNRQFEDATGLRDAVGRTALELVPSLESHWIDTYTAVAHGESPARFQQTSQAMGRTFDVFAMPVAPRGRFALIFQDITERHTALEGLQESERRFRNMADHAPVMIWVTDHTGECTYLNRRWYEFTGQAELEALGRGWLGAVHPEDRAVAAFRFTEATRHRSAFSLDYRLRRADGALRWTIDAAAPRFNDDGQFLGYVGSVMDITERKEAEQALKDQRDREHSIAVRLQESMLPTALVDHDDLEIAAVYVAGTELLQAGGDWYETFHLPDGRIGIVVGDVVGHDIEAAAAMGQLRAGLLALADHVHSPSQLLCDVDRFVQRYRITNFATALCIFLDPRNGAIEYSSAGHPPALLCPRDGTCRWLDLAVAVPLGMQAIGERPTATETLDHGDVIVVYSDGLIERRGESLDVGLRRLEVAVRRNRNHSMTSLCSDTLDALADRGGYSDDTVLVGLRRSE